MAPVQPKDDHIDRLSKILAGTYKTELDPDYKPIQNFLCKAFLPRSGHDFKKNSTLSIATLTALDVGLALAQMNGIDVGSGEKKLAALPSIAITSVGLLSYGIADKVTAAKFFAATMAVPGCVHLAKNNEHIIDGMTANFRALADNKATHIEVENIANIKLLEQPDGSIAMSIPQLGKD